MKHTTHIVTLHGITPENFRERCTEASLSVAEQIASALTPEQRDAIVCSVLATAVLDHLATRLPWVKCHTEHGRGVNAVCTSCLQAAGLDLSSIIRILS
jgi:hypothetical protein